MKMKLLQYRSRPHKVLNWRLSHSGGCITCLLDLCKLDE